MQYAITDLLILLLTYLKVYKYNWSHIDIFKHVQIMSKNVYGPFIWPLLCTNKRKKITIDTTGDMKVCHDWGDNNECSGNVKPIMNLYNLSNCSDYVDQFTCFVSKNNKLNFRMWVECCNLL